MAHSAAFITITATQMDWECQLSMCQFHAEADQAWKDTNNIIFSHQLRYDSQLATLISTAEVTLQAKWDEIWRHIHDLMDMAGLSQDACLTLAL